MKISLCHTVFVLATLPAGTVSAQPKGPAKPAPKPPLQSAPAASEKPAALQPATIPAGSPVSTPGAAPLPAPVRSGQWEYLVLSFGKVYFSPSLSLETKQSGESKLLNFSQAGVVFASEAAGTQAQLDTLGRYDWELVTVVGAIGGDQQFVFKRPWEPERGRREAALIAEEGRRLAELQKAAAANKQELVELDEEDKVAEIVKARKAREDEVRAAVAATPSLAGAAATYDWAPRLGSVTGALSVSVAVDGTSRLVKEGYKYRRSEGETWAKQLMAELKPALKIRESSSVFPSDSTMEVSLRVTIQHGGKLVLAGRSSVRGEFLDGKR